MVDAPERGQHFSISAPTGRRHVATGATRGSGPAKESRASSAPGLPPSAHAKALANAPPKFRRHWARPPNSFPNALKSSGKMISISHEDFFIKKSLKA